MGWITPPNFAALGGGGGGGGGGARWRGAAARFGRDGKDGGGGRGADKPPSGRRRFGDADADAARRPRSARAGGGSGKSLSIRPSRGGRASGGSRGARGGVLGGASTSSSSRSSTFSFSLPTTAAASVGPAASAATFTAALALGGAAAYWPGGGAGSSSPRGGRRYDGGLTSGDPRRAATDALLWTTAIGYVLQVLTGHAFTAMGAKVNAEIAAGQVYRLVTPLLLHGSPLHLLVNCMSLHNLGPVIERQFGRDSFVGLYLASGIGGNYLSYKMCPNNAVGASGAIFGLVGAMGVYLHRHSDLFGAVGDRQLQSLLGSVGVNALFGMMSRRIDNWAHLGGFLTGAFVAAAFGPNLIVLNAGSHAVSEGGRRRVVNRPVLQTYASEFAREFRRK